ncbi:MAG TPA: hypothetical protein VKB80_12320 [Kofleriaceae bacterium]|nr:hypothetical protein [Kofleriaceae bacterium]
MARRDVHLLLGMAALTVALLLVQAATGVEVLMVSPFLVLALPLLAGRYVGERRIQRLVARFAGPVRRAARRLVARVARAPRVLVPRGGRLVAASLAERGPPATLAAR